MQLVLVLLGLVLIAVGLYFAVGGVGEGQAGAAARNIKLEGPPWLILVAIGVGVVVFAATTEFGTPAAASDTTTTTSVVTTSGPVVTTAPQTETTIVTTTTSAAVDTTIAQPPSGCVVTINNPFVPLNETPDPFGNQIMAVPQGTYPVVEVKTVSFAGSDDRWLKVSVDGVEGWVEDNIIFIAAKSGCTF